MNGIWQKEHGLIRHKIGQFNLFNMYLVSALIRISLTVSNRKTQRTGGINAIELNFFPHQDPLEADPGLLWQLCSMRSSGTQFSSSRMLCLSASLQVKMIALTFQATGQKKNIEQRRSGFPSCLIQEVLRSNHKVYFHTLFCQNFNTWAHLTLREGRNLVYLRDHVLR